MDVHAFALVDSNGNLTQVFSHASTGYSSAPSIQTSPFCTKILISGQNGSAFSTYFFFIDYSNQASTELIFPSTSVLDPANVRLLVDDSWLYVRQLASSLQSVSGGNLEYVYAIVFDSLIEMADVRNISAADEASNTGTFLRVLPDATLYVLSLHTSVGLLVKRWQILAGEGQESGGNADLGISQVVIDGQVKLCPPGCSDCSTGVCTACSSGYSFDSTSAICYLCDAGCTYCSATDSASCTACSEGYFLSGISCLTCDINCITCSGSASSCQNCMPGQYFNGTGCADCGRNCMNCTSSTTCTSCRKGFAVTGNGTCRGCSSSCSSCAATDITTCTSCARYLELVSGECVSCPSKCKTCSGGKCAKCQRGYRPSSDKLSCIKSCVLPCRTCVSGSP